VIKVTSNLFEFVTKRFGRTSMRPRKTSDLTGSISQPEKMTWLCDRRHLGGRSVRLPDCGRRNHGAVKPEPNLNILLFSRLGWQFARLELEGLKDINKVRHSEKRVF
jgi:hypothetical protein